MLSTSLVQYGLLAAPFLFGQAFAAPTVRAADSTQTGIIQVKTSGKTIGCLASDFSWRVKSDCATFTATSADHDQEFKMFYLKNDAGHDCSYDNEYGECRADISTPYMFMATEQTTLAKGTHIAPAGTHHHFWYSLGTPEVCEAAKVHEYRYKFLPDIHIRLVWQPKSSATKNEKAAATCGSYTTMTDVAAATTKPKAF